MAEPPLISVFPHVPTFTAEEEIEIIHSSVTASPPFWGRWLSPFNQEDVEDEAAVAQALSHDGSPIQEDTDDLEPGNFTMEPQPSLAAVFNPLTRLTEEGGQHLVESSTEASPPFLPYSAPSQLQGDVDNEMAAAEVLQHRSSPEDPQAQPGLDQLSRSNQSHANHDPVTTTRLVDDRSPVELPNSSIEPPIHPHRPSEYVNKSLLLPEPSADGALGFQVQEGASSARPAPEENRSNVEASQQHGDSQRRSALHQLSLIRSSFSALLSNFTFPSTVDFADSSTETSVRLDYTTNNRPIHEFEEQATRSLTQVDAVDIGDDEALRRERKALVNEIQGVLGQVDTHKLVLWQARHPPARHEEEQPIPSTLPASTMAQEEHARHVRASASTSTGAGTHHNHRSTRVSSSALRGPPSILDRESDFHLSLAAIREQSILRRAPPARALENVTLATTLPGEPDDSETTVSYNTAQESITGQSSRLSSIEELSFPTGGDTIMADVEMESDHTESTIRPPPGASTAVWHGVPVGADSIMLDLGSEAPAAPVNTSRSAHPSTAGLDVASSDNNTTMLDMGRETPTPPVVTTHPFAESPAVVWRGAPAGSDDVGLNVGRKAPESPAVIGHSPSNPSTAAWHVGPAGANNIPLNLGSAGPGPWILATDPPLNSSAAVWQDAPTGADNAIPDLGREAVDPHMTDSHPPPPDPSAAVWQPSLTGAEDVTINLRDKAPDSPTIATHPPPNPAAPVWRIAPTGANSIMPDLGREIPDSWASTAHPPPPSPSRAIWRDLPAGAGHITLDIGREAPDPRAAATLPPPPNPLAAVWQNIPTGTGQTTLDLGSEVLVPRASTTHLPPLNPFMAVWRDNLMDAGHVTPDLGREIPDPRAAVTHPPPPNAPMAVWKDVPTGAGNITPDLRTEAPDPRAGPSQSPSNPSTAVWQGLRMDGDTIMLDLGQEVPAPPAATARPLSNPATAIWRDPQPGADGITLDIGREAPPAPNPSQPSVRTVRRRRQRQARVSRRTDGARSSSQRSRSKSMEMSSVHEEPDETPHAHSSSRFMKALDKQTRTITAGFAELTELMRTFVNPNRNTPPTASKEGPAPPEATRWADFGSTHRSRRNRRQRRQHPPRRHSAQHLGQINAWRRTLGLMILEGREQGDSQHPRPAHMRMPHLSRFHPTPVQVRRFASGQSTGPARGLFSLRFSASGSDQWNRAAFERFLERHYPQGPSEDQRDAAAEYFETFIRSLRRARAQRQAAEGDEAGAEEQRGLRAENQRTYSLAWSRVETARTIPALRQFVPLLTALGPDGTSDDERQLEDDVHVMWYIRPVAWRDPRIRPLLDMIDHITSTLAETDLRVDRRGNRRRRRLPGGSARARNRSVPIGLPLSLYNQQWLNRLPQPERQFLEQQATDEISLAVPEELYAQYGSPPNPDH